jgi:hypothetical protein
MGDRMVRGVSECVEEQGRHQDVGIVDADVVPLDRTLADAVVPILGTLSRCRILRRPAERPVPVRAVTELFGPAKDRAEHQETNQEQGSNRSHGSDFQTDIKSG